MADEPAAPQVEVVPTHAGQLSAIASAQAPFIYFDDAASFGISPDGIVNVTLVAVRHLISPEGRPLPDRTVTAHLRFGRHALASLREAIDKIELLAQPPASNEKN